ncbi:MAG: winged helix-turn-helix domain-containing protein [Isosphaeraceae bacterium]|nr:winged helix-turn-helix domain-containing protein [Isosphaeraceae bacterium]
MNGYEGFSVLSSLRAVYDLLHRIGYSGLMLRPQHEEADPEMQEFCKEMVAAQIAAIVAEHPASDNRPHLC